ncbi:hypothetical protein BDV19DRAFT_256273 [Aspergillus venezuelensis]
MADYVSTRKCYFPNGVEAPTNVPCSDDEHTSCCDYRDVCLSNGLCVATKNQPYTISRGSCTNQNWDPGCPEYCREANPSGGSSIVNYTYRNRVSTYCCGTVVNGDNTTACYDGESPFTIPSGEAVPGYALLGNVTSLNTTTDTNTDICLPVVKTGNCHETAAGAGVRVPLGCIALISIAWALWERRKGKKALAAAVASHEAAAVAKAAGTFDNGVYAERTQPVSELDSRKPVAELNA